MDAQNHYRQISLRSLLLTIPPALLMGGFICFNSFIAALLMIILLFIVVLVFSDAAWRWLPVILLPIVWYLPEHTAPGGLLEDVLIIRWITVILIPSLFTLLFFKYLISRRKFYFPLILPVLFILVTSLLSTMANDNDYLNLLGYWGLYLRYPLFFILLVNTKTPERISKYFFAFFILLTLIQIPEVIIRYLTIGVTTDNVSYTLGPYGTYAIGVYFIYAFSLLMAHVLAVRLSLLHMLLVLSFFLVAWIGEIKSVLLGIPIIAIIMSVLFKKQAISNYIAANKIVKGSIITVLAFAAFAFIYYYWEYILPGNDTLTRFFDEFAYYLHGSGTYKSDLYRINRLGSIALAYDFIDNSTSTLLLGLGPGSSFAGNIVGLPGRVADLFDQSFMVTQINASLLDVGLLGLCGWIWYFKGFFSIQKQALKLIDNKMTAIVVNGAWGFLFFYIIFGPLYNIVWRSDAASYVFYFMMAYIYNKVAVHKFGKASKDDFS
jgi:hypothetical protein